MERALSLLIEQGEGNEAAVPQNNLAIARYPLQGPARSLADFEQGIAFCEQRGLTSQVERWRPTAPACSSSSAARRRRLSEPVRSLLPPRRAAGHGCLLGRALELATHLARGEAESASGIADWLVESARTQATSDVTVEVLAPVAAARLAAAEPDQARALLSELEQTPGARDVPYYARQLPAMLRTALAAGDPDLAERLADGLEPRYPLREHALCAARAQLAEHAGDHAEAATLYAEAAAALAAVRECPRARLRPARPGRCLVALADPTAEQPLRQAAELFSSMGYRPALTETNALLEQTTALPRRRASAIQDALCFGGRVVGRRSRRRRRVRRHLPDARGCVRPASGAPRRRVPLHGAPRSDYLKMLTARAVTSRMLRAETADSESISSLAHRLNGIASVGLNAIELVNDT